MLLSSFGISFIDSPFHHGCLHNFLTQCNALDRNFPLYERSCDLFPVNLGQFPVFIDGRCTYVYMLAATVRCFFSSTVTQSVTLLTVQYSASKSLNEDTTLKNLEIVLALLIVM